MKASDFDYHLPQELIAKYPVKKRDQSRLLVLNKSNGRLTHSRFFNITDYLKEKDLLILNNTRVIPAKIAGWTQGSKTEVLLTSKISDKKWKLLVKNPKENCVIDFNDGVRGVLSKNHSNEWVIRFNRPVEKYINDFGEMPLPPYIHRPPVKEDRKTYQTVYAKTEGAIAAPTAGLHFTEELLERIREAGVEVKFITLHVGIGTFRPVKSENIADHSMHRELVEIPEDTFSSVLKAKESSGKIVAAGTTVVRALESAVKFDSLTFNTELFIYPPYDFQFVDAMITNFHLPRSTLLMLVSAFCSKDMLFTAYREAINKKYRLLSYGDAMFIY